MKNKASFNKALYHQLKHGGHSGNWKFRLFDDGSGWAVSHGTPHYPETMYIGSWERKRELTKLRALYRWLGAVIKRLEKEYISHNL